jgi:N-acetylglucosamine malate deacetylase 1
LNQDRVLILSPHPDDAQLGAGGTIRRFLEEGRDIYFIVFSGCEASVPTGLAKDVLRTECARSIVSLGMQTAKLSILNYPVRKFPEYRQNILEDIIDIKKQFAPGLVLVPSSNDMHQDHGVIYWEALRAFKKEASVWGYEHPWNNLTFTTDIFVKLNAHFIERKIEALQEFKSQRDKAYMDEQNLLALSRTRGAQLDVQFAEAFELIRLIY